MARGIWRVCLFSALALSAAGCPPTQNDPSNHGTLGQPDDPQPWQTGYNGPGQGGQGPSQSGAPGSGPTLVQLDVYQVTVPFGSISRDDEFWKRVDETQLDIATYDLLLKNGIRVGIGADDDWLYFRTLINKFQATAKQATSSFTDGGYIDLPLHDNVQYQDLFYFNQHNELTGRTFVLCKEFFTVAFYAAKRHSGETLIKVCPVVDGLLKRYVVTEMGQEHEVQYSNPEKLYDLRLETILPPKHFLVIAPSKQSSQPDLIGSAFLDSNGPANRTETLILLVPHELKLTRLPDKPMPR